MHIRTQPRNILQVSLQTPQEQTLAIETSLNIIYSVDELPTRSNEPDKNRKRN